MKILVSDKEFYLINLEGNNKYYINKLGEIFSKYIGRLLRLKVDGDGYHEATLIINKVRKTYRVHRLVAMTFIENINNLPYINHINGLKNDNRVENLEWCTASYNNYHRFTINNIIHANEDLFSVVDISTKRVSYLNWAQLNLLISWKYIEAIKNSKIYKTYQVFERNEDFSINVYYNGEQILYFENTKSAAKYYNVKINSISYYLHRKLTKSQIFSRKYRVSYIGKKSAETIETTLLSGRE